MRILALDVGEKVIGCAVCDPGEIVCSPLQAIIRKNKAMSLGQLKQILKETGAEKIIIGAPINMDGTKGIMYKKIKAYAEKLKRHFKDMPIELSDERLSTWTVRNKFSRLKLKKSKIASGASGKMNLDSFCAMEILEDYLSGYTC